MKITYAIWQGSHLVSIDNSATSPKDIDVIIDELNSSNLAKTVKFSANVQKVEVR